MPKILIIYVSNTPCRNDINTMMNLKRISVNACNFNRQIMHGFIENNCDVLALFDSVQNTSKIEKFLIQSEDKIQFLYFYTNSLVKKYQILKQIVHKQDYKKIIIVSDALNLRNVIVTQFYAKLYAIKNVAIVTDLYRYFHSKSSHNIKSWLFVHLGNFIMHRFNGYMLLSKSMAQEDFVTKKPYFISEGVFEPYPIKTHPIENSALRVAIYAGTIIKDYGIIELMKAFNTLQPLNFQLHIYTSDQPYIEFNTQISEFVVFKGYVPREQLIDKLSNANLLINPRPLYHEFNEFSFPSKLIEYMASGVPTITTRIPSIPDSIKDYLNYFEGYDAQDFINGLQKVFSNDSTPYIIKAQNAKRFMLENYAHTNIANRIIQLVD